jgi:hypothetical protein
MKTTRNLLSVLLAAGAPGVALLAISNVIPADVAMAILAVGSLTSPPPWRRRVSQVATANPRSGS